MTPQPPPVPDNAEGRPRRVGVEIEFAGLPPRDTANLVKELFGGEVEVLSPHRLKVTDTRWGSSASSWTPSTPTRTPSASTPRPARTANGSACARSSTGAPGS